jgi:hypothetical protein
MTMKTSVIQTFLRSSNLSFVRLSDGLRLQVIPDISFLSRCQKHHFAAFIQDPGIVAEWNLTHRLRLGPRRGQLLFHRLVQRLPDYYYVGSFKVYFSIVIVFQALGTVSFAILQYRTRRAQFDQCFLGEPHLAAAAADHLPRRRLHACFAGDRVPHTQHRHVVGATSREAESTTLFEEVAKILQKFKFHVMFCFVMIAVMVVLSVVEPVGRMVQYDWQITTFTAIWPLSTVVAFHFLLPLVLNPGLMQFYFLTKRRWPGLIGDDVETMVTNVYKPMAYTPNDCFGYIQ